MFKWPRRYVVHQVGGRFSESKPLVLESFGHSICGNVKKLIIKTERTRLSFFQLSKNGSEKNNNKEKGFQLETSCKTWGAGRVEWHGGHVS